MQKPCNVIDAVEFVAKYKTDAAVLAVMYDLPTENILGLAAHESQYGGGRIAREDNNFFSMHAPAPLQSGEDTARGNANVKVAKFNSFYQCGKSFLLRFGAAVKGKRDPLAFGQALVKAHFNSGSAKTGGRDGYANLVADAIKIVKVRMTCGKD